MKKEKQKLVGIANGKEVWLQGQALEQYEKMTKEEQEKFVDRVLHTFVEKGRV